MGFFTPVEVDEGIRPIADFPVGFSEGTLSAAVSTDELSSVLFLHSIISEAGKAYVISQGRRISPGLLERLGAEPSSVLIGFAYRAEELIKAFSSIPPGSLVLVSDFPHMASVGEETILELRRITDERGLITILHHEALTFNELNPTVEFERLFSAPGLFDLLLVLRTSSYRGHYRLNITVLKASPEDFLAVGDHSIPVDGLLRKLKGQAP